MSLTIIDVCFQVIDVYDCKSVYRVPLLLGHQNLVSYYASRLKLDFKQPRPRNLFAHWKELADREEKQLEEVKIAVVGKYTKLEDAYLSLIKALKHASLHCNNKLVIEVSCVLSMCSFQKNRGMRGGGGGEGGKGTPLK